jgi:ethanolamine ammonia-lyase small subunit
MEDRNDLLPLQTDPPEPDPWASLKSFTGARIALGRSGTSAPLRAALAFRLAHARDAVYSVLDAAALAAGLGVLEQPWCQVTSQAMSRQDYLQRPDQGRVLDELSRRRPVKFQAGGCDVAIVLADGLSVTALNKHALPLLAILLPRLHDAGFRKGPVVLAEQARVAVGDEIGAAAGTVGTGADWRTAGPELSR